MMDFDGTVTNAITAAAAAVRATADAATAAAATATAAANAATAAAAAATAATTAADAVTDVVTTVQKRATELSRDGRIQIKVLREDAHWSYEKIAREIGYTVR